MTIERQTPDREGPLRDRVCGHDMAWWERGRGRPWLFVHGFPLDHSMWRRQIDAFSPLGRLLMPDLPGFGASAPLSGDPMTMADFADVLDAFLDVADVTEPIIYVGLSMGGYIAWEFYRRHRDRLDRLILCDTRAAADTEEVRQTREETAQRVLREGTSFLADGMLPKLFSERTLSDQPEVVEETARVIRGTAPSSVAAALRGMALREDMTGLLPSIDLPSLLIGGEDDMLTPPEEMEGMAGQIPGAVWHRVAGAGHMAPLERPQVVNEAIGSWLSL